MFQAPNNALCISIVGDTIWCRIKCRLQAQNTQEVAMNDTTESQTDKALLEIDLFILVKAFANRLNMAHALDERRKVHYSDFFISVHFQYRITTFEWGNDRKDIGIYIYHSLDMIYKLSPVADRLGWYQFRKYYLM